MPFDFTPLFPASLPPPAVRWTGTPKYNFVGGNNDPDEVPLDGLMAAAQLVLQREGRTLATYGLNSGPQGYRPLREFLAVKLKRDAGMSCTADDILIVSGSLQALDLVNSALLSRGDTVIVEKDNYQGSLNRFTKLGVTAIGIPLDKGGMRMDALEDALKDLKARGVTPKFIYTIPTVQNPTATVLDESRRARMLALADQYGVPIVEDDCYADLVWSGQRPPALHAMSKSDNVIHVGSFSKSIAPALRVGFVVAPWQIMSRMLALKTDAGSGALEQMVLAEYCKPLFATHVPALRKGLRKKVETLMEALNEQFGTAAEFDDPQGGIFLWVKLPDHVDSLKLYQAALKEGVAINPGPEWSTDKAHSQSRIRICFASPTHQQIREGIAVLAEVCRREFGVPTRSGNVAKA
ncbi:PLP-dependent aminotransferase family protein [Pseudolabrys sp. FHR47]|uniref:aminotransferase-like domain-containing protein n=1 Tax=Pseudolabrys sp. FHR47 TaxID=2562284 RepID=UPI0010BF57F6|nr:PLP-dependent aminotransferase family protein [Pseudolabrys sp. FHR47]